MAIEILSTPQGSADAGIFNLPPSFDVKDLAAEWVAEGQVAFKQQRQVLPQVGATADGWTVWKNSPKDAPTTIVGSGNKRFVLMCRPRVIQDQVNALFGNVSKEQINREVRGETAAGENLQDPGILTEQRLKGAAGSTGETTEFSLNKVENVTAAAVT